MTGSAHPHEPNSEAEGRGMPQERDAGLFMSLFFDNASVMLLIDPESGRIRDANPAACSFYGWDHDALCAMNISEINTLSKEEIAEELRNAASEKRNHFIFKHRIADGSVRDVEVFSSPVKSGQTRPLFSIIHDVTERKRTEELLEMFKATIETASDAVYWMDVHGRFIFVNDTGCQMLGYTRDELLGMDIFDVNPKVTPESWSNVWKVIRSNKKFTSETTHRKKDGSVFPVEIASTYCTFAGKEYVNGFARDLSDRKRTEEELQKTQRLESLGILAGGIAHDFNNLLAGIYGYVELALEKTGIGEAEGFLAKAMDTVERARGLTMQLLTFAKGGAPVREKESLFPLVRDSALFALSGSNIACRFEVQPGLSACLIDRNQIGQVIDNLIINAKQAMPNGGEIVIEAVNVAFSADEHPPLAAGGYVKLSIKDRGVGIPPDELSRIFDPFYTTKPAGHGLGLTSSYSIVKRHDGCIDVESEPGVGSVFHLYLPAAPGPDAAGTAAEHERRPAGRGTFLVMDDEEVIADTLESSLESLGFAVVRKTNAADAISFVSGEIKAGREIAGMIFDLTIPGGGGGKEAVREIRAMGLDTPVFVTSGYAEDPIMAKPAEYGFTASLHKPFLRKELWKLLNQYLSGA